MSVMIIAEAGVNHNGDLNLALEMIDVASEAGADAIKFQTFTAESLVDKDAPKASYQKNHTDRQESQYEMLKKLELKKNEFEILAKRCKEKNIVFMSSPFDEPSVDLICEVGVSVIKIPSGEITNKPYLEKIARKGKPVILSTGMACLGEVEQAMRVLLDNGLSREEISILHCNTEYPTPYSDVNLLAMQTLGMAFNTRYGYSDHTLGNDISIAAVALGATIIEKHFTLDKNLAGPDHQASMTPEELGSLVESIRRIEQALGSPVKQPSRSESKNISIVRKSLFASKAIKCGELFTADNLTCKRPGTGISPMRWDEIIGKPANKDYIAGDLIDAL